MQVECILSLDEQAFVVYGKRRTRQIIWMTTDAVEDVKSGVSEDTTRGAEPILEESPEETKDQNENQR